MSGDNSLVFRPFSERRVERAVKHVSDYWFPVNPKLMAEIRSNLADGRYENDLNSLISEITSDFSLFTHCLKTLARMLKDQGNEISYPFNPIQLLRGAGLEGIKSILAVDARDLSAHDLSGASELQTARFKEVLISGSTAELIANKYSVEPETAYSAALLRQLGFTLIAWNYPGVYEEAIGSLQDGESLDVILAKQLGFSPQTLALRVLHSWGISTQACASIGITDESLDEERIIRNAIGETISRLCKVGEALARANDPQHYPSAQRDWEVAHREVTKAIGADGIEKIQERYEEHCELYTALVPHIFKAGLISEPRVVIKSEEREKKNPYFTRCTPELQAELRRIYRELASNKDPQDTLRRFVQQAVPTAKFCAGCVYTMDVGLMMLVPQLRISETHLRKPDSIDYSVAAADSDIVAVAYQINEPVVEYREDSDGALFSGVAGLFGVSQRVGVLYLEIPECISPHPDNRIMLNFNALRFALNDCLSLR